MLDVYLGLPNYEGDLSDIFSKSLAQEEPEAPITAQVPDLAALKKLRTDDAPDCFFGPNVLEICHMADIVFMGLHGENGENGKVQAVFDLFGIRYTGTGYLGSALAMDKGMSRQVFCAAGVPVAKGITMKKGSERKTMEELGLGSPVVVKPCCGGSSIGVSIVHTQEEYEQALSDAFQYEDNLVVEQFIKGREFSVGVIEGKALPIIEIAPVEGFYDYKNKYQAGSAIETCPAQLSEKTTAQMQSYAEAAAHALGLSTYSRTDFMLSEDGGIYCLESNTLPGMTPTSLLPQEAAAIGISYDELCEKLIAISLCKYEGKE
jgi:D-alanine-D-alanine ligase